MRGRHFAYFYPDGKPVKDKSELGRITALAIPPAYRDVWVCPIPNGHIQATARDARGRKQYRYHKRWQEVRDEAKFHRMAAFGAALPKIRKAVARDLRAKGLTREKILAVAVTFLERTAIRIGNEEYRRTNGSFGLTTLRARHVHVRGSKIAVKFRGKTGKEQTVALDDARLARIIRQCRDLPGQELFEYQDDDGTIHAITSEDVNAYIREISGDDFSAKDFRTWSGTIECIRHLAKPAEDAARAKHNVKEALACVALHLGNTAAVCRKAYVHPAVIDVYSRYLRLPSNPRGERSVLRLLRQCEKALDTKTQLKASLKLYATT
ncbi:MAG: DNA topoisomerase IB [Vulcanimicrobiaceae bacterium]